MGAARLAYFVSKDVGNGKGVTLDTHTNKRLQVALAHTAGVCLGFHGIKPLPVGVLLLSWNGMPVLPMHKFLFQF